MFKATLAWMLVAPLFFVGAVNAQYVDNLEIQCGKEQVLSGPNSPIDPRPKRDVQPLELRVHDQLAKVTELMEEGVYEEAGQILARMLERKRNYSDNAIASIHQMYAKYFFDQEDQQQATEQLKQMLLYRESLNYATEETTLYQLSQLHLVAEDYETALSYINQWIELVLNPGPANYFYVAQVHYMLKDLAQALQYSECAIKLAYEREYLPIKEAWWTFAGFVNYEEANLERTLEIFKILAKEFPTAKNWVQLGGIFGELEMDREQAWTFEVAHSGGFLQKESENNTFASLLAREGDGATIRAAWYLQSAMDGELVETNYKSLKKLAQMYHQAFAVDDAIVNYEEAAPLAEDGETFYLLALQYYDQDDFQKCVDAVDEAFELGELSNDVHVMYLQGICTYEQDKLSEARKIFVETRSEAREDDNERYEELSSQWITAIDNEQARLDELDRMLRELTQSS